MSRKFKCHYNLRRIKATLHEDQYKFVLIYRPVLRRIKKLLQTEVAEKIKTKILCSTTIYFYQNRSVYEIMWKNIVQPGRPYRGADKSLARPTSRCILFDGYNISFDASLVTYIYVYIYIYVYC